MFTIVPFDPSLSAELAQRELVLEHSRSNRIATAQRLITALPPMVERTVRVLEPYVTLEGERRFRPVLRSRLLPVV